MNLDTVVPLWVLARELNPMFADLKGWDIIDSPRERITDTLKGVDGITQFEIDTLRQWSIFWNSLNPKVREFYRSNLTSLTIRWVLYCLLSNNVSEINSSVRNHVRQCYREQFGASCPFSLFPIRNSRKGI